MKVCFLYAEKERESVLADAFLAGCRASGDDVFKTQKTHLAGLPEDYDVYGMVGVKSIKTFHYLRSLGKDVLFFDKGYFRHRGVGRTWEYWRIAVNDHHPTDYIEKARHGPARWDRICKNRCVQPREMRLMSAGHPILIAGSSEKYNAFCHLKPPTEYAQRLVKQIRKVSQRPIIYRPKPTWLGAVPIDGTTYSGPTQNLSDVLQVAHCVVTHGSNTCFEAVLQGVPCIILGNGIARPISSTDLADVEKPRLATNEERRQWLANVAWCMFTEEEMSRGLAWKALRAQLAGEVFDDSTVPEDELMGENTKKPSKALLKKIGEWSGREKRKLTKAEQRVNRPFKKTRLKEAPDEYEG